MLRTEYFTLGQTPDAVNNIYFLDYLITPNTSVNVYLKGSALDVSITPDGITTSVPTDDNSDTWNKLDVVVFPNLPQQINQVAVDYSKSLLIFNPAIFDYKDLIEFKVEYTTRGELNYFKYTSNILTLLKNIVDRSNYRITNGLVLTKDGCNDPFMFRLDGGGFLYNGNFYAVPTQYIKLNDYGVPTFGGGFRSYLIVFNQSAIDNYLDPNLSIVSKPMIYSSRYTYTDLQDAITDVYSQIPADQFNLIVALVSFLYTTDHRYMYWVKYDKNSRTLELSL